MFLIGLRRSGSVCLLLFTLTLFANCFHCSDILSLTSLEVLPPGIFLHVSPFLQKGGMPLEGLGMHLVLPEGFFLLPLDLVQWEGWRSLWSRAFGARELASVSSVHSWAGDTGVALLRRISSTFYVRLALPPHLCTFDEVMGWESGSECFWLCSRLFLPSHLCMLGEVVRRVRFLSAAPVSFPPWPPDLRLERQGSYLSLLLVEWLSYAVLLLALSLRLPCSVKRSRHCEHGSSR